MPDNRITLRDLIKLLDWWAPHNKHAGHRRYHYEISTQVTRLVQDTHCPFTRDELKAYSQGWIYAPGSAPKNITSVTLTPAQGKIMEDWFEGYDLGGLND